VTIASADRTTLGCISSIFIIKITLGKSLKNKFLFTMKAYTGQTRTTLGQLCATLWDSQITASCDKAWIQTRLSVVTPLFHFGLGEFIHESHLVWEKFTQLEKCHARVSLRKTLTLFEVLPKFPLGKMYGRKTIVTIFMFDC
jgi:hypothetical protein